MITLNLANAEELAEATYFAEVTTAALAMGQPPRRNPWRDLDPATRAVKVHAAHRLIAVYRVEGSLGLLVEQTEPE